MINHSFKPRKGGKSIFRALFVPLFLIMILQAGIFYFAAVYGGIEEYLNKNAADILSQRLITRKNEIEAQFNNKWAALDSCSRELEERYAAYEESYGDWPLAGDSQLQIQFLRDSADLLINTLRHNEVNGVFLILNDQRTQRAFIPGRNEEKYGLCVRDMDQESNYSGREDLLLERSPSSLVDSLGCSLDSWWEARYTFASAEEGDYYYRPLNAAWENPGAAGQDLAYCAGAYHLSGMDPAMISYSLPLLTPEGQPFAVIGVELSLRYLSSLLPHQELNQADKCCYILTLHQASETQCQPIVGVGALYNRCFGDNTAISCADITHSGGFDLLGRGGVQLYGDMAVLDIYNNNNPFEDRELSLLALVEKDILFAHISRVKGTLQLVSLISLILGIVGLAFVSDRFAAPITALAKKVRGMKAQPDFALGRLGISEIDQLVESIEELNANVSRTSARTEFFSRMSHDMRTPMNAIISFSSPELLAGASGEVKDDYLEKIHASGEYLLALINEVLDITKIDSNKIELRITPLAADSLFLSTLPIIEKLAQKKGVNFTTDTRLPEGLTLLADEQHINQITMNLLSNAVKFTPAGGWVRLTVRMDEFPEDRDHVLCQIEVADNGSGMSAAFMDRMYTPFEQENSQGEGTGLGLTIAKKLTELMDGSIHCTSEVGAGATFVVSLPLLKGDKAQGAEESPVEPAALASLRGKRILVCEDNDINTQIIRNILERLGITVIAVENGYLGVEAFAAASPGELDGILMDIRMPIMDGLEATRAIRALKKKDAATIPIIAMTANAFAEDERASAEAGMNAHLVKPVEPQKLYAALIELL